MNINDFKLRISVDVNFIDAGFPNNIKDDYTIMDISTDGKYYDRKVYYIEHLVHAGQRLVELVVDMVKAERYLIKYIVTNLPRNKNIIYLNGKDIEKYYKEDKIHYSDIVKAIKKLELLDVIRPLNRLKDYVKADKHIYVVNHNYIFNGSIKKLYDDLKLQRNN